MADFPLSNDWLTLTASSDPLPAKSGSVWFGLHLWTVGLGLPSPPPVTVYKMRGMDAAISAVYDCWLSEGEPDTDASGYAGALAKPLRDVVVIDSWIK